MSAERKCTRCGAVVPAILSGPPDERDQWWRNVIGMSRVEIEVRYVMRLRMFRRRWLPENPRDQIRETYTELDLCDSCARDVFAFAQAAPTAVLVPPQAVGEATDDAADHRAPSGPGNVWCWRCGRAVGR